jgi:hypothetical protein
MKHYLRYNTYMYPDDYQALGLIKQCDLPLSYHGGESNILHLPQPPVVIASHYRRIPPKLTSLGSGVPPRQTLLGSKNNAIENSHPTANYTPSVIS